MRSASPATPSFHSPRQETRTWIARSRHGLPMATASRASRCAAADIGVAGTRRQCGAPLSSSHPIGDAMAAKIRDRKAYMAAYHARKPAAAEADARRASAAKVDAVEHAAACRKRLTYLRSIGMWPERSYRQPQPKHVRPAPDAPLDRVPIRGAQEIYLGPSLHRGSVRARS
jgi:hypothetical protein